MDKKELIWVPEYVAKEYNKMESEEGQLKFLVDFIAANKSNLEIDLEALDEQLLVYKGRMAAWNLALKDAYKEVSSKSEELFHKFADELPKFKEQIDKAKKEVSSVSDDLEKISNTLTRLDFSKVERLLDALDRLARMSDDEKTVFRLMLDKTS